MTDKMADQILKELEQSNRLVAELVKAVERQNEILDEKLDDIATAACNPNWQIDFQRNRG